MAFTLNPVENPLALLVWVGGPLIAYLLADAARRWWTAPITQRLDEQTAALKTIAASTARRDGEAK